MITGKISELGQFNIPQCIIDFLQNENFIEGRTELEYGIFVNGDTPELRKVENANLEWHEEYVDLQVPITSEEIMLYQPRDRNNMPEIEKEYAYDIGFCKADFNIVSQIKVAPGQFIIFTPEDLHGPICSPNGEIFIVKKYVFKIPVKIWQSLFH